MPYFLKPVPSQWLRRTEKHFVICLWFHFKLYPVKPKTQQSTQEILVHSQTWDTSPWIFQLRCHFCSWSTRLQRIRAEPVLVITITAGGLNNANHLHVYIYGHSRTHNAKHAHKKQNLNWMWLFPHTPPSLANNFYAAELNRCCKEHYDLLSYFSAVQRWKPERYDKLQTRLRLA